VERFSARPLQDCFVLSFVVNNKDRTMQSAQHRAGKIKYAIFAWLLGLPLPIIILALFFRGCDF
jgi:hypothetical protein